MSAENVKWQVNRAVMASNLPAPARLIMLVLSDKADAKTGEIPARRSPSNTDLARETGLGDSTVKAQLANLEALGWVIRIRPTAAERARHVPSGYYLRVGSPGDEKAPIKRKPRARSKPSEDAFEGQEQALAEGQEVALENESEGQEITPRGPGDSHSRARSKPSYIEDDYLDDHDDRVAADAAANAAPAPSLNAPPNGSPKPETANQRANRLAKIYTDRVPLSNFMAVRGVVAKAIQAQCTDQQISDGLNRLIRENRGVSAEQLRIAIAGPPVSSGNGYQPYQNRPDRDYHGSI